MLAGLFTFVVFFIVLSGMIFVHEFGHFIAARWAGVEVEEFGFGLPSYRLITLFNWHGTDFTIHALPLGGFVRPKGENDPNVPGGLAAANPWKRLVILFAGPLMNLLTAVVVFSLLIALEGEAVPGSVQIDSVADASPAMTAGLQRGDVIVAINGQHISDIQPAIDVIQKNLDQPVQLLVRRGDQEITLTATPLSSRPKEQGALGVALTYPTRPATPAEIISGGALITAVQAIAIAYLPVALIEGLISPKDARFVGLKGMFDLFGIRLQKDISTREQAAAAAAQNRPAPAPTNWTLELIGLLSVSLGVMNLFPIPVLDGGRILFVLPEILFRRRIPAKWENLVNGVALVVLLTLMVYVNAMDFINPVKFPGP